MSWTDKFCFFFEDLTPRNVPIGTRQNLWERNEKNELTKFHFFDPRFVKFLKLLSPVYWYPQDNYGNWHWQRYENIIMFWIFHHFSWKLFISHIMHSFKSANLRKFVPTLKNVSKIKQPKNFLSSKLTSD